jgi:predicted O-methyltransferase YrrM
MSTLFSPRVSDLLAELFADADQNDPLRLERLRAEFGPRAGQPKPGPAELAALARDVYMPISPETGRLLYQLVLSRGARTVVEFGTSLGISAIHLAAALRDSGTGRLVTTELDAIKAGRAQENLRRSGLSDLVEVRQGDAFETLRSGPDAIDLLLLDGWKEAYLPLLEMLEPRLAPGALVLADDIHLFPDDLAPYLRRVRDPANGFVSVELPLGDGVELSVRGRSVG